MAEADRRAQDLAGSELERAIETGTTAELTAFLCQLVEQKLEFLRRFANPHFEAKPRSAPA